MKHSKALILNLPEPCSEDWEQMKPSGCGRFCNQCQKTVIDFTVLSDEQIGRLFATAGNKQLCGRFHTDQLNRPIPLLSQRKEGWWLHKATAAIVLLAPFFQATHANAQAIQQTAVEDTGSAAASNVICISGSIKDARTGEALTRMEISIEGMPKQYSDRYGRFSFALPASFAGRQVIVRAGATALSAPAAEPAMIPEEKFVLSKDVLNYTIELLRYPVISFGETDNNSLIIEGSRPVIMGTSFTTGTRAYSPRFSLWQRIKRSFKTKQ